MCSVILAVEEIGCGACVVLLYDLIDCQNVELPTSGKDPWFSSVGAEEMGTQESDYQVHIESPMHAWTTNHLFFITFRVNHKTPMASSGEVSAFAWYIHSYMSMTDIEFCHVTPTLVTPCFTVIPESAECSYYVQYCHWYMQIVRKSVLKHNPPLHLAAILVLELKVVITKRKKWAHKNLAAR